MDPMILMFEVACNEARELIGKSPVADYEVTRGLGPIQRAFETAFYQDARAAEVIKKRDLALAEARRQVAPATQ